MTKQAAQMQQQQYQTTRGDELPFITTGQNALPGSHRSGDGKPGGWRPELPRSGVSAISAAADDAIRVGTDARLSVQSVAGVEGGPGRSRGRGLGVGGASLKGAGTYATGLADSTYQNQFANAQQRFTDVLNLNTQQQGNLTNQFNRYNALITTGAGAASQLGTQGNCTGEPGWHVHDRRRAGPGHRNCSAR